MLWKLPAIQIVSLAMAQFWDSRYGDSDDFAYGTEPNDFLAAQYTNILPGGNVLCLAEGEGRNAVFLAKQGFSVTAVDQSEAGLSKANKLAKNNGVVITTIQADLAEFEMEPNEFDGIISIFGHLPPPLREAVHHKVVASLKAGGVYILEGYTVQHFAMPGVGGPPPAAREIMFSLDSLRTELEGLDLIVAQDVDREVNEGKYHSGLSATVQVVGRKP
jgi:SAM-dependent methyltransferase